MSEVFMFNAKTNEMRFLNPHKREEIDKLLNEGWMQNPCLIHMYNPTSDHNINRPVQEKKQWEDKGYYANPTMIYHPTHGTKKVSEEDAKKAFKNGWYASPAFYPGNDIGKIKTPNVMKEAS